MCPRLIALVFALPLTASAMEAAHELSKCMGIADDAARLACYDRAVADIGGQAAQGGGAVPAPQQPPVAAVVKMGADKSVLDTHWELSADSKRGTFVFRPHQENYLLLANYSRAPNDVPFRPFIENDPNRPSISHTEMKFQLGFKIKLLEDSFASHSDLWFGYTQQSFWQAYNTHASSPFRDTNYQPELMLVTPVDFSLLGMRARFLNFGVVHQSNGQPSTLSRSWNRLYAQAGLERGQLTVLTRIWQRIGERRGEDDNPDILDYMGHGDLIATYRWRGHEFSALGRRNFSTGRGAAQISWAFPLVANLKGYIQAFSGYGQSLIDYNSNQTAIGFGFLVQF
jgi:phospholipase A1